MPIHLTHHLLQHLQRVEVGQLLLSLGEHRPAIGGACGHQGSALRGIGLHPLDAAINPLAGVIAEAFGVSSQSGADDGAEQLVQSCSGRLGG